MKKARKNIAENKEKNPLLPIHPTVSAKCPVPVQFNGGDIISEGAFKLLFVCILVFQINVSVGISVLKDFN